MAILLQQLRQALNPLRAASLPPLYDRLVAPLAKPSILTVGQVAKSLLSLILSFVSNQGDTGEDTAYPLRTHWIPPQNLVQKEQPAVT